MDSALLGLPGGNLKQLGPRSRSRSRSKVSDTNRKGAKNKDELAEAIKLHVGDVLSTLENEG